MLVRTKIVLYPVFICCVSFLKYSISEKPQDCTKGKQYWSTDIFSSGTCASCPPNWKDCDQQSLDDRASCFRSCRVVKSKKPKANPKTNFTTVTPLRPTSSNAPKVTKDSNASLTVVYQSPVHPPETKEVDGPKSRVAEESLGPEMVIVVCSFFGLVLLIGAILLYRKIRKKPVQNQDEDDELDEEESVALEPLQSGGNDLEFLSEPEHPLERQHDIVADECEELCQASQEEQQRPIVHESCIKQQPIVQASSCTNIYEPQHTKELNGSSYLNLDEEEF